MTQNLPSDLQNLDPGQRLGDIAGLANAIAKQNGSNSYDALVASTTQTQAAGTALRHGINVIATANNNDAVTMPQAEPGVNQLVIVNHSGQTVQLFPFLGDTINAAAANAAVTVATATTSYYTCGAAKQWWGGAVTNET